MSFESYWNKNWLDSDYPKKGEKWIYLVAGSRNLDGIEAHGGLWVNVGETTKSVEERLSGLDYARKAAGGDWVILNKWKVPAWFSDTLIHQELRTNPKVIWKNSANSEEFFFPGDYKNANLASLIIGEAIIKIMNFENEKVINSINSDRTALRKKLEHLSSKKERLDEKGPKSNVKSESKIIDWRDAVGSEKIWRKNIKDELERHQELRPLEEIKSSFLFSYFLGLASLLAYLALEPSDLIFLLVFLPVSSAISSIIGFYKTKKRWDSLISSLKEKL